MEQYEVSIKETKRNRLLSKHQIKKEETRPSSQSPLSPKKRKSKTLEISSKSTLKLAVAKRLKRDYAFSDIQQSRFSQQKPFPSEKRFKKRRPRLCPFRDQISHFSRKGKRNENDSHHTRARSRERETPPLSPRYKSTSNIQCGQ